jgi:hypothetical protein
MNSLVIQENEMKLFTTIAKYAAQSGLYKNAGGEAAIFMILLAAHDLGIKPTIALNGGIWNIQGKIEISARLMTSMIRKAGHSISIKECTDKICVMKGKRSDNGDEAEASFSIEDANKAGLAGRDVWKKYAEDMLYARAMSRLARRLFPDVIGTAYVEGEIRDEQQAKPEKMTACDVEVSDCQTDENQPPKVPAQIEVTPQSEKPIIDFKQLDALLAIKKRCDPAYVEKVEVRLTERNVPDFKDLPLDMYDLVMTGMAANARKFEKQKA